ncbi:MAG: ABC transporter permease, partial [Thermomicrobiaceae bacterium]|nr:ABC transporter permease [Thermomicrobiaceae bacterium]
MSQERTSRLASADLSRAARTKQRGYLEQVWRRFRRNHLALAALAVTLVILVFSYGAPLVSAYVTHKGYADQSLLKGLKPPLTDGYLLGSDNLGRDVLTRLAYGGRVSMTVAILATMSALVIGLPLGAIAGYYGGIVDTIIMRLVDILLSIPVLFLLIFVNSIVQVGWVGLAVVIALFSWMGLARLVRGEVLSLKGRDFITSARLLGASDLRIIFRHMVPNVTPIIIVWATLAVPVFIIVEATLSFLGLGVHIPTPSWGNMLNEAQQYLSKAWWLVFIPGFMIYIT